MFPIVCFFSKSLNYSLDIITLGLELGLGVTAQRKHVKQPAGSGNKMISEIDK